jgi:hypothetical protein
VVRVYREPARALAVPSLSCPLVCGRGMRAMAHLPISVLIRLVARDLVALVGGRALVVLARRVLRMRENLRVADRERYLRAFWRPVLKSIRVVLWRHSASASRHVRGSPET